ncbi:MAG: oligosaccharide flippase family protein [Candidatus Terrybacteria bacterium]|nr:oligosaccharide flippase family protein [Candidatus Terrybacteria bacterium]
MRKINPVRSSQSKIGAEMSKTFRTSNGVKEKAHRLLRWSEKYFKTDMVYLAHGGFWLTLGQIFSALISLGLSIAYANLLTQQTFGTYKYILSAYGIISLFVIPGLSSAVTRSVSRGFEGSIKEGFKKKIKWGTIAGIASFLISIYYLLNNNLILSIGFLTIGLFLPLMESFGLYSSFLEGKKLFKERVLYEIGLNLIFAAAILLTIFLTKNLFIILAVYFISNITGRIIFYFLTVKKFKTNNLADEEMDSYGRSLSFFQIVSNASQYLDKILLFTMLGAPQVAIFTFASALPDRIKYLFRFTGTISFPKFAGRPAEEIKKNLPKKLLLLGLIISFAIVAYILAAPLIFKYIFPQYKSAVFLSQIISLTSIYAITYPIGSYLSAHKKVRELFMISGSSFLLGLICLLVFIPFYGIWGAVIGAAANRLTIITTSFYFLKKIKD